MTALACLSFDVEEFDAPLERGQQISEEQQFETSRIGLERVLAVMDARRAPCTLFCTARFARRYPDLIRSAAARHEIASHGWAHSKFAAADLGRSREELERISGTPVIGFRMPRMAPVDKGEVLAAGYRYNASENPVWLPGRYNNFFRPRLPYLTDGLLNIPASATPIVRFPLFWLSFKNFPGWLYRAGCARVLSSDGALNTYFHPWEFADLAAFALPGYARRLDGERLAARLSGFLDWLAPRATPATYATLASRWRDAHASPVHASAAK